MGVGMVICAMVSSLMPVLIVLLPLGIIQTIWCLIDSYIVGRRSPRAMLGRPLWRYLAGIAIVAASLFINPALWAALAIRSHLFEAFSMPSDSMAPTLVGGDRFIVNKKKAYGRWSIVGHDSLDHREVKFCKRIVGLPGERIDIVDGELMIDGKRISRPAEIPPYRDPPGVSTKNHNFPLTLGKDEYFVIGDNSTGSGDSRIWSSSAPGHQRGVIPKEYIFGTVTAIYWPAGRWRRFE